MSLEKSAEIFTRNRNVIPGGVVSVNRAVVPEIAFLRGQGSRVWDADGTEYIDYHAGFAPYILGHNDRDVNAVVKQAMDAGQTLMGSGTNTWEGRCAELIVKHVPSVEQVMLTNTGSEATFHAVRLARAHTGKHGVIVMQGGYNGWHNDVAVNVMTPLKSIGIRVSPGEYKKVPLSAGIPEHVLDDVHVVNFNDLDSVRWVMDQYDIAVLITEPILQNIGIVKPAEGYLEGLRKLCTERGVVLVFDEVKTGFRHALGGYQSLCGVMPDLSVFGKAIANGYPMGAIGGKTNLMHYFVHEDASKRVLIAGTYNAHPFACAGAIGTMEKLASDAEGQYGRLNDLGKRMESGLVGLFRDFDIEATVCRQGSAFCAYFMNHAPVDWHDVAGHHDFAFDERYRNALIGQGIYHFPLATKQGSISLAHSTDDIDETLEKTRDVLKEI
jgi:glutamate-1-semialdehyde 2,1-aminomutase